MPIINFERPDMSGHKYIKEAINTDFLQMARYVPYTDNEGQPAIYLVLEGSVKKYFVGPETTDIYRHVQALPDFIEWSKDQPSNATRLLNTKYVVYMFYRDKSQSSDNESILTIEYGLDKKVADREPADPRAGIDVSSSNSIHVRGDEADAIWSRIQGTTL